MNIYVGNLELGTTEAELRSEFIPYGQVLSIIIMNDKYIGSGQPRVYGFIEMASKSDGESAVTGLNGKRLRGRVVTVVGALPLSDAKNMASLHERKVSRCSPKSRQREHQV